MQKFIVKGTHLDIGRMVGEEFRLQINTILEIFRTSVIPSFFPNRQTEDVLQELERNVNFVDNISRNTPGLFEEIKGMSLAANASLHELVMLNCLDEVMSYSNQKRNSDKCTCLSIKRKDNNQVYVAQNLDLSTYLNKYQVVLHLKHDENDTEQLLFTTPGYLGYTGVNSKSVAVVPNSLTMLNCNPQGVPVTMLVRSILEKQSAGEAVEYVLKTVHGAAQNYTIGDSNGIYSLECSGYKKEVLEVSGNQYMDFTVHTNHPLKNDDLWIDTRGNSPVASPENSLQRQKTAEKYMQEADSFFTDIELKKILTSHDSEPNCICRHDNNGAMTLGSVVYKLTDGIEMHFAGGPGCINRYEKYTFN